MTTIEQAERKGKARASAYYVFAAMILLLLLVSFGIAGARRVEFTRGMWLGVVLVATMNLVPFHRWLKPGNALLRLLDDESVREHRRMSRTAGFWAAMICALAMTVVARADAAIAAIDVARTIGTAAIVAALVSFATLELRASR